MDTGTLYSVLLVLRARHEVVIPVTMGHWSQALFLNLVKQFDPTLSARLHDEPGYRPYTISPLIGGAIVGECILLRRGQPCRLRITLLDGGTLWCALQTHFLEAGPIYVHLGDTGFQLVRILSTPTTDSTNWASSADWQSLNTLPAQRTITMHFSTATAFSLSERRFGLFPEPPLVWGSLLRNWNSYAPDHWKMDKQAIRASADKHISVTACKLSTEFLHFPAYVQKGFIGHCTYQVSAVEPLAAHLTTLASFALYSGVGYKTTMGMGQVRVEFGTPSSQKGEQKYKTSVVSCL